MIAGSFPPPPATTTRERGVVAIDSISESPARNPDFDAIVLVDVMCDATTLVTAVEQGREVFPVASAPAALGLARRLEQPLLAVDEEDAWRPGFELHNSPASLAARPDRRPLVLSCATGLVLAVNSAFWPSVYVACWRNVSATVRRLRLGHRRVLVLAGVRDGDVRCEDQIGAAHIARGLVEAGFEPDGLGTCGTLARWGAVDFSLASWGRSAEHLRQRRRQDDLEFVLSHIDDIDLACRYVGGRLDGQEPEETIRHFLAMA